MGRLSMDFATNTEKIEPKTKTLRRQSTGSLTIQITQPNYLKASTGSCHDICKYGVKRASPDKPWSPVVRKDNAGRKASASPKLMPMSSRQHVNELLKPKPLKTTAVGNKSSPTQTNHASITTKNRSPLPLSSPKVLTTEIRTTSSQKKASRLEIKYRVEKNDMKKTSFENVPEKIIHVVKPAENESRNKSHPQESYNGPARINTLRSKQKQQLNLVAENEKRTTRPGARVITTEEKDSSTEKLKLRRVKVVETENGNVGSNDGCLRRSVSDGKLIIKKNVDSVLTNSVIEEKAKTLVNMRKGTVEALVRAFESVIIKAQDS